MAAGWSEGVGLNRPGVGGRQISIVNASIASRSVPALGIFPGMLAAIEIRFARSGLSLLRPSLSGIKCAWRMHTRYHCLSIRTRTRRTATTTAGGRMKSGNSRDKFTRRLSETSYSGAPRITRVGPNSLTSAVLIGSRGSHEAAIFPPKAAPPFLPPSRSCARGEALRLERKVRTSSEQRTSTQRQCTASGQRTQGSGFSEPPQE